MGDITALHEQLKQELRFLAVLADQAGEGIVIIDLAGTVRFVNTAWVEMHGYKITDRLVGKHISAFYTKEKMETEIALFIKDAQQGGKLAGLAEHLRIDGTVFPTKIRMITVKDEQGGLVGLIIYVRDITKQKQTEDATREDRQQLEQHMAQQIAKLTEAGEKLQQEITKRKKLEQRLRKQASKLTAANKQIKQTSGEHVKITQHLSEQRSQLKAIERKLQQEIARRTQAEDGIVQLQAKLDSINSIAGKYF